MGGRKRKERKRELKKKIVKKLETVFDCPFCNHNLCVEIKLYPFFLNF